MPLIIVARHYAHRAPAATFGPFSGLEIRHRRLVAAGNHRELAVRHADGAWHRGDQVFFDLRIQRVRRGAKIALRFDEPWGNGLPVDLRVTSLRLVGPRIYVDDDRLVAGADDESRCLLIEPDGNAFDLAKAA